MERHHDSALCFEQCVGKLAATARTEALIQGAREYVLSDNLDDALRLFGLFRKEVPLSLRTADFEAQYSINTKLRLLMLHFDALLPPLVMALLLPPSGHSRDHADAVNICHLWYKIVEHLKSDLDPELAVCVSFALLHSSASDVALAQELLESELRRCLRMRVESFAQYMRRLHNEKTGALSTQGLPAGCFEAHSVHEVILFNLVSWVYHSQGDAVACAIRRDIVRRGCALLHIQTPDYGQHDLNQSHALLMQQQSLI
jgi:hypothetical protein